MLCKSVYEGQRFTTGQTEDKQPTHPRFTCFSITASVMTVCTCYITCNLHSINGEQNGASVHLSHPRDQLQTIAFSSQQVGFIWLEALGHREKHLHHPIYRSIADELQCHSEGQ